MLKVVTPDDLPENARGRLTSAIFHLEQAAKEVEGLILWTPTGPTRDSLTDANIYLRCAKELFGVK